MRLTMRSSRWHAVLAAVLAVVLLISTVPFVLPAKAEAVGDADAFNTAVGNNSNITLTSDITLSGGTTKAYSGKIDGNGHVIRLNGSAALFTDFTGTAQDVGVIANGIVNDNGIFAQTFHGTMTACFVYGKIGYTQSGGAVGGLVGSMTGGTVTQSFGCVTIESATASHVGGLIGTISGGTVSSCYSAGYVKVDNQKAFVGGFANLIDSDKDGDPDGNVSDTYTSCQLVNRSSKALPSGVNGLYDNQLSVVRESVENPGLSTRDLTSKAALKIGESTISLSDKFAVTSTAYPHLTAFDAAHWCQTAEDIARVSVAAVAFSDVDATRVEPSWGYPRADYLTLNSYLDKTNEESFHWTIDSTNCKVYDTVPVTFVESGRYQSASSADLLRSKFVFTANTEEAELTVKNGDYARKWLLSAYNTNPYFASGSTANELRINDTATLDCVRYYSRIGAANYKVTASFTCGEWDSIDDFNGVFNGNYQTISDIAIENDGADALGLFASSQAGSQMKDLALTGVTVKATEENPIDDSTIIGGLVGKAVDTAVSNVLVSVELSSKNGVGGLVGNMTNGSVDKCGVTGYLTGASAIGGLIGITNGTTIKDCYSTAAVFASDSTASSIGGLLGSMTGGSLTSSYVSALVDAASGSAMIGTLSGATITSSYYDNEMTTQSEGDYGQISDTLATVAPSANWTVSDGHYPQLTVFTNNALKELSAVSTQRVYFQKYWKDAAANNMTTGWIAESSGGTQLNAPTEISGICDGDATVIAHTAPDGVGYMFEASSSSRLLALHAEDTVSGGVRVIAAARDDMIQLAYTVSGVDSVRSYMDIYYSSDNGTTWQGSQVMSQSKADGSGDVHTLYDMPKNSIVKIRVRTIDNYQVQDVTIGDVSLQKNDDGYYYSTARATDTVVDVVLEDAAPEWGIRLETY